MTREAAQLNAQAAELYGQGRYKEAIAPAQHALSIKEKALGPEHPGTATSLNNLATLYDATVAHHGQRYEVHLTWRGVPPTVQTALRETSVLARMSAARVAANLRLGNSGDYLTPAPLIGPALSQIADFPAFVR